MKENVASVEVSHLLGNERSKMEIEKQHMERDLMKERDVVKKSVHEMNSMQMKVSLTLIIGHASLMFNLRDVTRFASLSLRLVLEVLSLVFNLMLSLWGILVCFK